MEVLQRAVELTCNMPGGSQPHRHKRKLDIQPLEDPPSTSALKKVKLYASALNAISTKLVNQDESDRQYEDLANTVVDLLAQTFQVEDQLKDQIFTRVGVSISYNPDFGGSQPCSKQKISGLDTAPLPRQSRIIRRKKKPHSKKRPILSGKGMFCRSCGVTETTEWRRGPDGCKSLCNACGLHFSKILKKERMSEPQGISAIKVDQLLNPNGTLQTKQSVTSVTIPLHLSIQTQFSE